MSENAAKPAFPHQFESANHPNWSEGAGLTKLEYLTAAALSGLCANPHFHDISIPMIGHMAKVYAEAAMASLDDPSFTMASLTGGSDQ